ncbi:CHRD domain-containing protein [Dankookia sp. P2]|uniref:CHRD domain-containing protein n=1 Tax=Dankookia sp. P2 TaxID=3423955 RepID=UPI003D666571
MSLTGRQEVPSNASAASGGGTVIWDEAAGRASCQLEIKGLDFGPATGTGTQTLVTPPPTSPACTSTASSVGSNGSVVFGQINPAQDADDLRVIHNADGFWTITGAWKRTYPATMLVTDLNTVLDLTPHGLDAPLCFNVHSTAFPSGEIRGQLVSGGSVGGSISNGFAPDFYKETYPDLTVLAASSINSRLHVDRSGWKEGRDPNALFGTSGYLHACQDVAAAGVNRLEHFLAFGIREGQRLRRRRLGLATPPGCRVAAGPRPCRLFPRLDIVPEVEGEVLVRPGLQVAGEAGLDAGVVAPAVAEEAGIFPVAIALVRGIAPRPSRRASPARRSPSSPAPGSAAPAGPAAACRPRPAAPCCPPG